MRECDSSDSEFVYAAYDIVVFFFRGVLFQIEILHLFVQRYYVVRICSDLVPQLGILHIEHFYFRAEPKRHRVDLFAVLVQTVEYILVFRIVRFARDRDVYELLEVVGVGREYELVAKIDYIVPDRDFEIYAAFGKYVVRRVFQILFIRKIAYDYRYETDQYRDERDYPFKIHFPAFFSLIFL